MVCRGREGTFLPQLEVACATEQREGLVLRKARAEMCELSELSELTIVLH
jgi:hypothetical protein